MKDTVGNEIDNNTPVYLCETCNTTAGRMGCYIHRNNKIDTDIEKAVEKMNYKHVLKSLSNP